MRGELRERITLAKKTWTARGLRRLSEEILLLAGFLLTSSWLVRR